MFQRLGQRRARGPVVVPVDADDDPIGRKEVRHGDGLARELRVVRQTHRRIDAAQLGGDGDGRAGHERAADDDRARCLGVGSEVPHGGAHEATIPFLVGIERADTDDDQLRAVDGRALRGEAQASVREPLLDEIAEAGLVDRQLATT